MENLDTTCFIDEDLLDFTLEGEEQQKEYKKTVSEGGGASSFSSSENSNSAFCLMTQNGPFPEFEEELEWLSNKDAFPAVETCFGILADNPELILNHQSPVSVLENSSISSNSNTSSNGNGSNVVSCCESIRVPASHPVRARSKRRRSRRKTGYGELLSQQSLWLSQVNVKNKEELSFSLPLVPKVAAMGRRCLHCQADKTPQWRAGPMGPKTLCNACGVRYKSGRLLPEYRPANSPTFSSTLHSNSHRKVVEMRKQKHVPMGGGMVLNETCG